MSSSRALSRPFSIYLDLIRALAAFTVLLFHAAALNLGGRWLQPIVPSGTLGVIAFFVLSGFVISYVADTKETGFKTYLINRLARLWSVVIPALALTVIADMVGRHFDASIYPDWYPSTFLVGAGKIAASAVFMNQIWTFGPVPLSNGPFWSLGYEFWYYICFGSLILIPGRAGKLMALIAFLIMGPKIWLLFPVWLLGVAIYRHLSRANSVPYFIALLAFFSPLAMHWVVAYHFEPNISGFIRTHIGERLLGSSNAIDPAIVFAPLMGLNIFAAAQLTQRFSLLLLAVEKPIRYVAGGTLSMYLYHYPLLLMFGAILRPSPDDWSINLFIIICTVVIVFALQPFTEAKKDTVRRILNSIISHFAIVPVSQIATAPDCDQPTPYLLRK